MPRMKHRWASRLSVGLRLAALDLGLLELRLDRADDACRDLVLQVEDVVELALEAIRPEMRAASPHR